MFSNIKVMIHNQGQIAMRVMAKMDSSTSAIAHRTSHALAKITGQDCSAHDIEEDSFELSLDGERYAGGSYYINRKGILICASVTPQIELGHINNPDEIAKNLDF
ncbi:MAG: hypothetical protein WD512_13510 [Candidatus Paceibacterota bacterium]